MCRFSNFTLMVINRLLQIFYKSVLAKIDSNTAHMGLTDNIHPSTHTHTQWHANVWAAGDVKSS